MAEAKPPTDDEITELMALITQAIERASDILIAQGSEGTDHYLEIKQDALDSLPRIEAILRARAKGEDRG